MSDLSKVRAAIAFFKRGVSAFDEVSLVRKHEVALAEFMADEAEKMLPKTRTVYRLWLNARLEGICEQHDTPESVAKSVKDWMAKGHPTVTVLAVEELA